MARKITLTTYENNSVYSVSVFDSYRTEHHLGYIHVSDIDNLEVNDRSIASYAHQIWSDEVKPEENLLGNAIRACNELDKENGLLRGYSDGLD